MRVFPNVNDFLRPVPNVPCGVESDIFCSDIFPSSAVPNVPCGVERRRDYKGATIQVMFLMYRVELKAASQKVRPKTLYSRS